MIFNLTKKILKKVKAQPKLHISRGGQEENEEKEMIEIEVEVEVEEEEEETPYAQLGSAVSPSGDI